MDYDILFSTEYEGVLKNFFSVLIVLALLIYLGKELTMGICTAKTKLEGKIVVVTGGNIGIGFETAQDLGRRGARVIIGCRNESKGNDAVKKIIASTGNRNVSMMHLDLTDFNTVRKFAKDVCAKEERLHILVNSAGIAGFHLKEKRTLTKDNNETVVQTNHLGHFLLTNLLRKPLAAAGNARVVNVSSQGNVCAKDINGFSISDINSEKLFHGNQAYFKSKLLNILFSNELAARWKSLGVSSFSLHPGFVRTEIFNLMPTWAYNMTIPLAYLFGKSTYQGAQTTLHCCLEPGLENYSGSYWSDCRIFNKENCPQGNYWKLNKKAWDNKLAEEIWEKSATLVSL